MTTVQERQLEARITVAESDMKRSDSELHLVENGSADLQEVRMARPEELKRHAEAQEKYRAKNLEATRTKARERMQRQEAQEKYRAKLRANCTPQQIIQATEKRRSSDADYNEQRFVAKHGHLKYLDYYCPQYKLQGKSHLPGLRFDDLESAITQNKAKTPKKN
ncbi:hypothetical protein B0H14DRAFT_2587550 [Mycena olivaceomarginata]|nr:hypothetical protein B0H14DRAFT_2587550 [Mycena olivaceomarginata]